VKNAHAVCFAEREISLSMLIVPLPSYTLLRADFLGTLEKGRSFHGVTHLFAIADNDYKELSVRRD